MLLPYAAAGLLLGAAWGPVVWLLRSVLARKIDAEKTDLVEGALSLGGAFASALGRIRAAEDLQPWTTLIAAVFLFHGGWVVVRPMLARTSPVPAVTVGLGILAGTCCVAITFRAAAKLHSGGRPLTVVVAMLCVGTLVSIAIALGISRLAMCVEAALARRWGQRSSARIVIAAAALPFVVLGGTAFAALRWGDAIGPPPAASGAGQSASRPNVILISVDTLRPDFLGCNGGPARTPAIDALAGESFVFDEAYSVAPWTRPSFAAFFSGVYPSEMGVGRIRGRDGPDVATPFVWRADRDLLAEVLKHAGYGTAAVVTNTHLIRRSRADQGFDVYHHCVDRPVSVLKEHPLARCMIRPLQIEASPGVERAEWVSSQAVSLIEQIDGQPVLLWLHYMDPHDPYDAPGIPREQRVYVNVDSVMSGKHAMSAAERKRFVRAYTKEIEYCDRWIGRVTEALRASGMWDSSIVVFWSDHGEEFWEHNGWRHGHALYNEQLHVPLFIRLPGQDGGRRIGNYVSLLDVMPTLLELCHCQPPPGLRGRSLVPTLSGDTGELAPFEVYLEACVYGSIRKGIMTDRHKLMYDTCVERFFLYGLRNDPEEQRNIHGAPSAPDTEQMEQDLLEWCKVSLGMMYKRSREGPSALPSDVQDQLEDVGYL